MTRYTAAELLDLGMEQFTIMLQIFEAIPGAVETRCSCALVPEAVREEFPVADAAV